MRSQWAIGALLIAAAAIGGCVQAAPLGGGGSALGFIAYVRDGDVWIVAPDGSNSLQLTRDGAEEAYRDPAVAPDGTVYALRDEDTLYRFDLTGRVIGTPVPLGVLENGGEGLSVSPDGAHLAFVTTGWGIEVDPRFGYRTGSYIYGGTDVITPDGASVPGAAMGSMLFPSWAGPSTLVLGDGVIVYVDTLEAEPVPWLYVTDGCLIPSDCPSGQEPMAHFARAAVNSRGTIMAYQYQPYFGTAGRRIATIEGPLPAPVSDRCMIEGQQDHADSGSLSDDGTMFTFDDTYFDPDSLETIGGQGVFVMTVNLEAPDCGFSTARLVGPGGYQPDFGPAAR